MSLSDPVSISFEASPRPSSTLSKANLIATNPRSVDLSVPQKITGAHSTNAPSAVKTVTTLSFSFPLKDKVSRDGEVSDRKTGSKVEVPEKYVPHFKAGKELRDRVDK